MLSHELDQATGILHVRPEGSLTTADFEAVAADVDPYIEEHGKLQGLVIEAERFPGWQDFSSLVTHLRFVRDHHRQIRKVAAVSDSEFLAIMPSVVNHFVEADVRHFDYSDREAAIAWIEAE